MTAFAFSVVLFAAVLHATWNAVVKGGADKLLTTILVTACAALIAALALPFLPAPAKESWPFIGASALLQVLYFCLVARTYRIADMSQTYPLMRGSAPLIVAAMGALFFGVLLTPTAWLGIAIICAGIISMAIFAHGQDKKGVVLALLNAAVIAGYTLIDGQGVRLSRAPAAYTLLIFLFTGVPLLAWAMCRRRAAVKGYFAANWHLGMAGGFGTVASYGLALWAMTVAPVAVVAALRETSILFGLILSGLVLRERISPSRVVAACIIAIGAGVLRLA
ncbi:EamA family transporter [Sodalis sp. RH22]|uniref:EamA family transporter n=1 Tax=unclassified Sodalis (in: enterobacteria) TaxID=2636512 RepID=UPI0039B61530